MLEISVSAYHRKVFRYGLGKDYPIKGIPMVKRQILEFNDMRELYIHCMYSLKSLKGASKSSAISI